MEIALIAVIALAFLTAAFVVLRRWADPWAKLRPELMKMLNDAEKTGTGDTSQIPMLLNKAKEQYKRAQNASDMDIVLETYQAVLTIDPMNYEALVGTATMNDFKVNLFLKDRRERQRCCLNALTYSVLAMCTNPTFKARIKKGEREWEAVEVLAEKEMGAMLYWVAAVTLWLTLTLRSTVSRLLFLVFNKGRIDAMIDRMLAINPAWNGGDPYMMKAGHLAAYPSFLGGDLDKAAEYCNRAIELSPLGINRRVYRAMFLHTRRRDRDACVKDLEWVVSQDLDQGDRRDPYNIVFQRRAKKALKNIDKYF